VSKFTHVKNFGRRRAKVRAAITSKSGFIALLRRHSPRGNHQSGDHVIAEISPVIAHLDLDDWDAFGTPQGTQRDAGNNTDASDKGSSPHHLRRPSRSALRVKELIPGTIVRGNSLSQVASAAWCRKFSRLGTQPATANGESRNRSSGMVSGIPGFSAVDVREFCSLLNAGRVIEKQREG
jgi:hypothetical protein